MLHNHQCEAVFLLLLACVAVKSQVESQPVPAPSPSLATLPSSEADSSADLIVVFKVMLICITMQTALALQAFDYVAAHMAPEELLSSLLPYAQLGFTSCALKL